MTTMNPTATPTPVEEASLILGEGERGGLPWWVYFNPELLEIEKEELFRRCWQLVGHVSDIPEAGDYMTLDVVGERALVIRGRDGVVRGFHNVCRHRGSRVVKAERGHCHAAIVCPFHGWSYNLDGQLRGVPKPRSLPKLDPVEHGLVALDTEIWMGFVFVRFLPSEQPSVAEMMAPYVAELTPYRLDEVKPLVPLAVEEMGVNWKAVRDVDNEGYHVPTAHPSLQDLYGQSYADDPHIFGTSRSFAPFNPGVGRRWSVQRYKNILPENMDLPESHRRAWLYIGMFPNLVISLYPDQVSFYQEFPIAIDRTIQRGASYALPDERREMKLARYLAGRIDRVTSREDTQLIQWSWESMQSSGFAGMILSDLEQGVRSYHDQLRRLMPVVILEEEPAPGSVLRVNSQLLAARNARGWDREPG
jgi:phenylpropionate dioxygenase-like ring-hydroxylating dioxygenase large terminal subunit